MLFRGVQTVIFIGVLLTTFAAFAFGQTRIVPPPVPKGLFIKCHPQAILMKQVRLGGFRILFNWMSEDGKLIKLVMFNDRMDVLLVHIVDSERACVIDKLSEGTYAPALFINLFGRDKGSSQ